MLAILAGLYIGQLVPWKEQELLYTVLRNVNLVLFGVIGAWFAVLFPLVSVEKKRSKDAISIIIPGTLCFNLSPLLVLSCPLCGNLD